jgi:hypothetical protein
MEDRLLFLVSPPRSGSTLLARMLGAHPRIAGGPEPHLLTPLAHLGYFERVDAAPYDPVISQEGVRELVARLPGGEADYVAACRRYADHLYERWLAAQPGKSLLLDKTPAYALALPFIARLYPRARYVVLTRTPLAVLSSQAASFFDGDYEEAERLSPVLERYVPAIARFLREADVPKLHVRYEELVAQPAEQLGRICALVGVPFEERMIEYGGQGEDAPRTGARGLGDPTGVTRHTRPVTSFVARWAQEIASDPKALAVARRQLARLDPADLAAWGYSEREIAMELASADPRPPLGGAPLTRYRLERRLVVTARRAVQRVPALGRLLRRIRIACDVLLR